MRTPTGATRIEDWDAPQLPAPARLLNTMPAHVATRLLPLDEAHLLAAAQRRTGLADFGDEGFREPLRMILGDLEGDELLTPLGRATARTLLGQLLRARLVVEDRLRRDPSLAHLDVPAPIVIVGLPRTGTTHLHNLLSRVETLRSLPLWESVEPLRPPGARLPDLRRARAAARLRLLDSLLPLMRRMHEMEADLPHEELQLTALDFRSFFFEGSFRLPTYRPWYASKDQTCAYLYLRRVLQALQAGEGPRRWVLKSPQHLEQIRPLKAAFPDVRIVRTHRDPVRAALSLATMITYSRRVPYRGIDPRAEAALWVDRIEQMLRASLEQAREVPSDQILDVRFDAFLADPEGTVARVLDFAGLELDARSRGAVRAHLAAHSQGRHGRVDYDFASLGLDPHALRERFRFYSDAFGLDPEP